MKRECFAIYDCALGAYLQPFMMQTAAQAIRATTLAMRDDEMFRNNPQDFELYVIASFDDETGEYKNKHTSLGKLNEFVNQYEPTLEAVNS